MDFFQLLQDARQNPRAVTIGPGWGQGRASFGGAVAAVVYTVMRQQVVAQRLTRSLSISFVAPVAAGIPVRVEAEVLREGKAVTQVLGRAWQNDHVVALVQGSFGASRRSAVQVEAEPAPAFRDVGECQELAYVPPATPAFIQHLAMRWAIGDMPFTGSSSRTMGGWVRFRDPCAARPLDEADLLALVDAWPPALLSHLQRPALGSSLTWTIEFVQPQVRVSSDQWCRYRAEIEQAGEGYGYVAARIWSQDGQLLAISRQTVTVFD